MCVDDGYCQIMTETQSFEERPDLTSLYDVGGNGCTTRSVATSSILYVNVLVLCSGLSLKPQFKVEHNIFVD